MKKILLLITLSATFLLSSETKEIKHIQLEFYSIGMLPEGYSFVCLDGHKWLQHEERDKVVLQKLYYED